MKLRSHLFWLVLLAVVPVVLFSAGIVYYLHRQELAVQQATLVDAARALSLAVDRELTASIRSLQVLATSEHLAHDNVEAFHAQAKRTLAAHGAWQSLELIDRHGNMIANTRVPFGNPLPRSGESGLIGKVIQTGRPAVSNLTVGGVAKSPIVKVGAPVVQDGAVKYVINAVASPSFLLTLLSDQLLPMGWIGTVVDQDGRIIVRTDKPGQFEGWPAPLHLGQLIRNSPRGAVQDTTHDGIAVVRGYQRSNISGWTVAVALPVGEFEKPLRQALLYTAGTGIGFLTFGLILANLVARRIALSMAGVAESAQAIGRGELTPSDPSAEAVTEIEAMSSALAQAAAKRAQTEQALLDALDFNKQALAAIPDGVWATDRDLRYILWSDNRASLTGVPASEALGQRVGELFSARAEELCDRLRQVLSGEIVVAPDHILSSRCAEGSPRWVSTTLSPLRNAAGEIVGVLGINTDVTERKQAEAALADSEARFRAIFDQAAVGVAMLDSNSGRLLRVNRKYCEIVGYSESELLELDFMRLTLPEDLAPDLAAMEQLKSGRLGEFSLEKRLVRKDGRWVWVNLSVSAMWPAGAAPTSHIAVIEDTTMRKQADSERGRLASIIEAAPDFIASADLQGRPVYLNPGGKRLMEVDDGHPFTDRRMRDVHPAWAANLVAEIGLPTALREGHWSGETALLTRSGREIPVSQVIISHKDSTGQPEYFSTIMRDISKRKLAENKIAEAEKRFRAMIENSADGVALLDAQGTVNYLSPSASRITGRGPSERVGTSTGKYHHPDDASIIPNAIAALLRDPASIQRVEFRTRHQDGSWRWIEAALTNRLDDPNVQAIVSNYRDISARRAAEAAERALRSLIESTLDSLPLEIAVLDADGAILSVNRAWREFAESNQADLDRVGPGANYLAACTGTNGAAVTDGKMVATALSAVLAGTLDQFEFEYRCDTPAQKRFFACHAAPIRNHPQAHMVIVHEDITERKAAEDELHRVNEEIQQLYEVARGLHASTDLQAMGETILNQALSLSGCDLGVIRLREDANAPIRVIARRGYRDPENLQRHGRSPVGPNSDGTSRPRDRMRVFELRQTDIVEQIEPDERMATFFREGIRSLISIPVTLGDTPHCIMQLGSRTRRRFEPRLVRLLETLAHDFGIAAQKARLLEQALVNQERLRELSRRVVDAQESERRYIARELHDEIGSLLSALKIMIKLDGGETTQSLSVVDEALAKTRAIAQHLRPPMLDDLGLAPTLAWYAKEFSTRTKIAVEIKIDGIERRFGGDIEIAVFRIFQEALTNVARHAQASSVVALFSAGASLLRVTILDNGVGFDTKKTLEQPSSSGLSGMRERVAALGGRIEINRDESGGTAVAVEIPLPCENDNQSARRSETLQ